MKVDYDPDAHCGQNPILPLSRTISQKNCVFLCLQPAHLIQVKIGPFCQTANLSNKEKIDENGLDTNSLHY